MTPLTAALLSELERAAREATPGPWTTLADPISGCNVFILGPDETTPSIVSDSEETAAFIAAASPDVVLGLVQRIRDAEADRDAVTEWLDEAVSLLRKARDEQPWNNDLREFVRRVEFSDLRPLDKRTALSAAAGEEG